MHDCLPRHPKVNNRGQDHYHKEDPARHHRDVVVLSDGFPSVQVDRNPGLLLHVLTETVQVNQFFGEF